MTRFVMQPCLNLWNWSHLSDPFPATWLWKAKSNGQLRTPKSNGVSMCQTSLSVTSRRYQRTKINSRRTILENLFYCPRLPLFSQLLPSPSTLRFRLPCIYVKRFNVCDVIKPGRDRTLCSAATSGIPRMDADRGSERHDRGLFWFGIATVSGRLLSPVVHKHKSLSTARSSRRGRCLCKRNLSSRWMIYQGWLPTAIICDMVNE